MLAQNQAWKRTKAPHSSDASCLQRPRCSNTTTGEGSTDRLSILKGSQRPSEAMNPARRYVLLRWSETTAGNCLLSGARKGWVRIAKLRSKFRLRSGAEGSGEEWALPIAP
ncbi:hypothetical protein N7492_003101 [Penicillium capsulatum]|uniref:Uncharacterized protein n=1 Tax=Penicillium capsulatum TaxID=69766 RepID=A0A9W9LVS7_9EURO|nr:hypothetical protein N7492_003101 [Penicillium capsulatum]KAJ6122308.1 hypothetical protein N7512_004773 [Penicillium capsulatum]